MEMRVPCGLWLVQVQFTQASILLQIPKTGETWELWARAGCPGGCPGPGPSPGEVRSGGSPLCSGRRPVPQCRNLCRNRLMGVCCSRSAAVVLLVPLEAFQASWSRLSLHFAPTPPQHVHVTQHQHPSRSFPRERCHSAVITSTGAVLAAHVQPLACGTMSLPSPPSSTHCSLQVPSCQASPGDEQGFPRATAPRLTCALSYPPTGAGTLSRADQQAAKEGPVNLELQRACAGRQGQSGSLTPGPGRLQEGQGPLAKQGESMEVSRAPAQGGGGSAAVAEPGRSQGCCQEFGEQRDLKSDVGYWHGKAWSEASQPASTRQPRAVVSPAEPSKSSRPG